MIDASDRGQHCPFLNRTDSRCGSHFTLERLEHAFEYCFDRYNACPVYLELLVERRIRRGELRQDEVRVAEEGKVPDGASHDRGPLVEITIHAKRPPKLADPIVRKIAASASTPAPNRAA
jgi:hypothetical protein